MHTNSQNSNRVNHAATSCSLDIVEKDDEDVTMAIVPVIVGKKNGSSSFCTYAFLDPGSNVSLISETLMHQLGCDGPRRNLTIKTMGTTQHMNTVPVKNLQLCDLEQRNIIDLPVIYSKRGIPVKHENIPTTEDLRKWPHLAGVILPQVDAEIGLLLGNNVPDAYTPLEIKSGPIGTPHVARTRIGVVAWNVIRPGTCEKTVNRYDVHISAIEQLDENRNLEILYQKSVSLDFTERTVQEKAEHSIEDKCFLKSVEESKVKDETEHYELCLPFKEPPVLPDNTSMVLRRLNSLHKKLLKNETFHSDYCKFMCKLLEKGYAEPVPNDELARKDGKTWYLPHHGVYHPHKPDKIRVVFDCSAKWQGVSLNDVLLQGPNLTNDLVDVLLKFRQEPTAVMGDIEQMFYQVKVKPDDRDCMRFYWWPDGDLTRQPTVYRMVVHLFGASSSPSCASFALRQTVLDNVNDYSPDLVRVALSRFYVDDFLCSVPTTTAAIELVKSITNLCQKGGFNLTKWASNNREVLASIPESQRAKGFTDLDLDHMPIDRALGVVWDTEEDKLQCKYREKKNNATRRGILAIISSIYDPLGFIAPFILPARKLLQELCKKGVGWDDALEQSDVDKWNLWASNISNLEGLSIPRCMKPASYCSRTEVQLHIFSDASDEGYGVVAYLRFSDSTEINCSFVIGKSRVAPMKKISTPRMELTAATIAVKLAYKITESLDYMITSTTYWTDSMAVIRYINNTNMRYQTFVANRLTIIHDGSKKEQWKHVMSESNPADVASRGISMRTGDVNMIWFRGPSFLYLPESEWPSMNISCTIRVDDPEIKRQCNAAVVDNAGSVIEDVITKYSSWSRMKRITAWILSAIEQFKRKPRKTGKTKRVFTLSYEMLQKAETVIMKHEQSKYFSDEILDLESGSTKQSSSLNKLDPFLMEGVIRVGGRLRNAPELSYETKHPILLPKESLVSKKIVEEVHRTIGHLGKNSVIAKIREMYWILGVSSTTRRILSKCVICRKYQARLSQQKMADLPIERVECEPAFSKVGIDYFGPFEAKRGRSMVKRYGVIFTCLTIRAVHIEMAHSLTTDSCINAIRRFIARRGVVKMFISDNGTNLVGAERELREEIELWNKTRIQTTFQQQGIHWNFNPPAGSHFGGVWERLIRSIRKIMYSLRKEHTFRMDDEGLQTLFCEVESIMNNRPISTSSGDITDCVALTPNHLINMRGGETLPCGDFKSTDCYTRRRWRHVQYLADQFWKRWMTEYLPSLQIRQKWTKRRRNIGVNDIVLIADNTPRNSWTLGRVTATIPDKHGLVRRVTLRTRSSVLERPIDKLCLILESE